MTQAQQDRWTFLVADKASVNTCYRSGKECSACMELLTSSSSSVCPIIKLREDSLYANIVKQYFPELFI